MTQKPTSSAALLLVSLAAAIVPAQGERRAEVLIRDVSVLNTSATGWVEHQDIIIHGTTFFAVQRSGQPRPPAKTTIQGKGKFAIPGLFDNHIHFARFTPETAALLVAHGVTSVRDMGTDPARIAEWRRDITRGKFMGPRIVRACGPMLEGGGEPRTDHWAVDSAAAAEVAIDKLRAFGMDCVKVRSFQDTPTLEAIAVAARRNGLMLTGHALEPLTPVQAITLGQRTFEHAFYPYPLAKVSENDRNAMVEAFISAGAAHVPTLIAWAPAGKSVAELRSALTEIASTAPFRLPPALLAHWENYVPRHEKDGRGSPGWRQALATAAADIGMLRRQGVLVLPGSDTGAPFVTPGRALHEELSLLVRAAGISPSEALRAATADSAKFHGRAQDLGSIEPGKLADLVLLDANPLSNIENTRAIDAVVFRGEALTRAHLNMLLSKTISETTSK